MIAVVISVLISLGSALADSGPLVDGGKAIVCRGQDGSIKSAELLDSFEARILYGMHPEKSKTESWTLLAKERIQRLEKLAPLRSERYYRLLSKLENSSLFLPSPLVLLKGDNFIAIPRGCGIEQAAILQPVRFDEDKLLVIQKQIWDALSISDRTNLMVHSVINKDQEDILRQDTSTIRYLVALMSANKVPDFESDQDLLLFFRDRLHFSEAETRSGFNIALQDTRLAFYPKGGLLKAALLLDRVKENIPLKLVAGTIYPLRRGYTDLYLENSPQPGAKIEVEFYPSGRLRCLQPEGHGLLVRSELLRPNLTRLVHATSFADNEGNSVSCLFALYGGYDQAGHEVKQSYYYAKNAKWLPVDTKPALDDHGRLDLSTLTPILFNDTFAWQVHANNRLRIPLPTCGGATP